MINFTWDNSTFFVICLGAIAWMVICYFWFPHIAKNMVNHFYNKHNYYALEERLSNKWSVIEYKDFSKAGRDSPDIDQDQLPYLTSFVFNIKDLMNKFLNGIFSNNVAVYK